jgi:hypothetical protein
MQDLLSYISATDPSFVSRIRGARAEEIQELESTVRMKLPPDYREFLSQMGHEDGGLRIGNDSSTRLRDIKGYYADVLADDDWNDMIPSDCIVIAYSGVRTPELSLEFLGTAQHVIFSSGPKKLGECAESLEKLLFRSAFSNVHRRLAPHSAIYEAKSDVISVDDAAAVATRLGFAREWFSDRVCYCGVRGGSQLFFQRILGRPLWLRVSAPEASELDVVGMEFQRDLDLAFRAKLP